MFRGHISAHTAPITSFMLDTGNEDDVREHVVAFMRLRKVTNSSGSAFERWSGSRRLL